MPDCQPSIRLSGTYELLSKKIHRFYDKKVEFWGIDGVLSKSAILFRKITHSAFLESRFEISFSQRESDYYNLSLEPALEKMQLVVCYGDFNLDRPLDDSPASTWIIIIL